MAEKGLDATYSIGSTEVGELFNIVLPELTKEAVDVSVLKDKWRKYRSNDLRDGGEVTLEGYYKKGDTGQTALKTAFDSDIETESHVIELANGAKVTFSGIITALKPIGDANLDDTLGFSATIKVSGQPVYSETPQA